MNQTETMLTAFSKGVEQSGPTAHLSFALRCPICKQEFPSHRLDDEHRCLQCGFEFLYVDGILRALPEARKSYFRRFIQEYETVREKEGRGSATDAYYLALPFSDLTGKNSWQWDIRARTYRYLVQNILPKIEKANHGGCDVLDIGAGNCWLSYRLACRGHRPVAIDLLDNNADGLGAGRHYLSHLEQPFVRIQAEMDNLPFASAQFDIAIFNASFHYSTNYQHTLKEVVRCLRSPGYLVIADSPFYDTERDGQAMLAEKQLTFIQKFGISPDAVENREYLTPAILGELAEELKLRWTVHKPWYGVRWMLRPAKAFFSSSRKPSKFHLFVAKV